MNKINILNIIGFLFFSLLCKAQVVEPVFILKPVAGINACQIHGDNASGYNKPGLNGGIMVNSRLSKKFSIDLGIIFTQKGAWKQQNPKANDYNYFRINVNYIEMPLLLNVKANSKYFITLGPSIGYLVGYSAYYNGTNYSSLYHFNKLEYNVNFGLGRKIKGNWLVEVRSTNSVIPILNYGQVANLVFYPNAVARFFNKGLYNNILTAYFIYEIHPKKKSESPK